MTVTLFLLPLAPFVGFACTWGSVLQQLTLRHFFQAAIPLWAFILGVVALSSRLGLGFRCWIGRDV